MFNRIEHLGMFSVTHAFKRGWCTGVVAALGVSARMAASSTLFLILKWLGAAYLVHVGGAMMALGKLQKIPDLIAKEVHATRTNGINDLKNVFWRDFWTPTLSPQVTLPIGFGFKLALTDNPSN